MIREHGRYRRVHLFYAGAGAGAVCFGRAYNPRMNPGLVLYEHTASASPVYERVLTLNVE
jgi:SMODS-associated and fused to various effectors sensor domain